MSDVPRPADPAAWGHGPAGAGPLRAWVLDIGNTRSKFGAVGPQGELVATYSTPTPRRPEDPRPLPPWTPAPVHAISVVSEAVNPWRGAVVGHGLTWQLWGDERPLPIAHGYAPPARPGSDQLVAAFAAWWRARGPAIVVDAGSAVTVDIVAADGRFLGGAIAPGIRAIAAGLAAVAPALPAASAGSPWTYPAQSTPDAVAAGLGATAEGMIRVLVERAWAVVGPLAPLFVTGGDAERFGAYLLGYQPTVVPELVLEGLARLATKT